MFIESVLVTLKIDNIIVTIIIITPNNVNKTFFFQVSIHYYWLGAFIY